MKNYLFFALLVFSCALFADLIEPGTHPVSTSVRFVNIEEYPFATFYLVHDPIMGGSLPAKSQVIGGEWIKLQGYKFDSYYLEVNEPGKRTLNATVKRYNRLPDSDSRREVRASYKILYDSSAGWLGLEEVESNSPDGGLLLPAVMAAALLASGAAMWKLKGGKI
jgi:hypothetical protein